jgi:Putative adhesin
MPKAIAVSRIGGSGYPATLNWRFPMSTQTKTKTHSRCSRVLSRGIIGLVVCLTCRMMALAQATPEFHQTYAVSLQEPVTLDVDLARGDLQVLYSREGQVSITALVQTSAGAKPNEYSFQPPAIEQNGNHFTIRQHSDVTHQTGNNIVYRIDVPYRTEVTSYVHTGQQSITGIMGPVKAIAERGDIHASYISKSVDARVDTGNLDLQVVGERAEAKAHHGNISCERSAQGVTAETEDGDITLMVVGPSTATVKKGSGRIEVGGARGTFVGSTDAGDLHIKAVPHGDWRAGSASGNIRLELPQAARFELDASTNTGELQVDRDDVGKPDAGLTHLHQTVNGGGKRIEVHTESGRIAIR